MNPAYQALMDQHTAALRDAFDFHGVNIHDPHARAAVLVALRYVSGFHPHWQPWAMAVTRELVA